MIATERCASEVYDEGQNNAVDVVCNGVNYAKEKGYEVIDVDGVRIEYPDGFALVRKSNTSPSLTVRFEGKTLEQMEAHRLEILKLIDEEL